MTTIVQVCAEIDRSTDTTAYAVSVLVGHWMREVGQLRAALDAVDDENSQLKVKLVIALGRITELEDILGRSEDKRYEP